MKRQLRVICIIVFCQFMLVHAYGLDWTINYVASNAGSPSLYLDADSNAIICYREYNRINGDISVKYATSYATGWDIQTVYSNDVRDLVDAAWDTNGRPHISFTTAWPYGLHYSTLSDNGQWQTEVIDPERLSGTYSSITIDNLNRPRIAHCEREHYDLKYASFNGISWDLETVDNGYNVGADPSIKVDSLNRSHISYCDAGNDALKYTFFDGIEWQTQIIDENDGRTPSMALDSYGNPHIAYWDSSNPSQESLRYTMWDGDSWNTEIIAVGSERFENPDLILSDDNQPIISFHDGENEELKLAYLMGESWIIDTIDYVGYNYGGVSSSMFLDENNILHIAYNNATERDLLYATAQIPEPCTLSLFAIGGLLLRRRKN